MCCTWLAENIGRNKSPKIRHVGTIATDEGIDNRKNNLLSSNISSTRSHNMVNFSPLTADIDSGV